jgi:hypothetical protein
VFLNVDYNIYSDLLQRYFPPERTGDGEGEEEEREGETCDGGQPSAAVTGAREPVTAAEERDKLPVNKEVKRDVPILMKSITVPGIINQPEGISFSFDKNLYNYTLYAYVQSLLSPDSVCIATIMHYTLGPPGLYSKPETDKKSESQGSPPPPLSTGTLAGGDDTGTSAAAAISVVEGREGPPPPPLTAGTLDSRGESGGDDIGTTSVAAAAVVSVVEKEGPATTEGHGGVGRDVDNMDDDGSPSSKRSRLDEAERTSGGELEEGEEDGKGKVNQATAEKAGEEGGTTMEVDSDSQHQEMGSNKLDSGVPAGNT